MKIIGCQFYTGDKATGVYRAGISVGSWAETPITNVIFRDLQVEYSGGGTAKLARQPVKGPGVDARPLPAWGLYTRNVKTLVVEDSRFSLAKKDFRPMLVAEKVGSLSLENTRFTEVRGVEPFRLDEVNDFSESYGRKAKKPGFSTRGWPQKPGE